MKLTKKIWLSLIVFSLFGQVAWTVENMFFNIFIYQEFHATPNDIALMVSLSAITATLTTLLIGALSDKMGKRKIFICFGYLLWGLSIISFALLKKDYLTRWFPYANAATLGVSLVIIFDCIMTFFGSTANDACFNAWQTDITTPSNRGKVEGVVAIMPLIAILLVFGGFSGLTFNKEWGLIFTIIGIMVFMVGLLGFFFIKDYHVKSQAEANYFKNILYGFKIKVIKENKTLYLFLLTLTILGIALQVFMPYLLLYYQYRLQLDNYVIIFAPAIILSSIYTIIYGRLLDKYTFLKTIIPAVIILMIGLLFLFLFSNIIMVFIGTLLMMSGDLTVSAGVNAQVRNYTPKDSIGLFQGLRVFANVLIPMIIGPWIGAQVINSSEYVTGEDGVKNLVPTADIFLAAFIVSIFIFVVLFLIKRTSSPHFTLLTTPFKEQLQEQHPWPEYPRPQFKRDSYINLNGLWEYRICRFPSLNQHYDGQILVPFPLESQLSQVQRELKKGEYLFYHKEFSLPDDFKKDIVFLNFGAVDQIATIFINHQEIMTHDNGYLPFCIDITGYLKSGINDLIVRVKDDLDLKYPHGKQSKNRGGIWYTPISGIWQTVWMESVHNEYIKNMTITPDIDKQEVNLKLNTNINHKKIKIAYKNKIILEKDYTDNNITIKIPTPMLWSPEAPHLYDIEIITSTDHIYSYFAMRKYSIGEYHNYKCLCLNNQPYFFNGLLDQGYYSDGIYLPATLDGYSYDITKMKELGYNTLRKHIKIEPLLWYFLCDSIGMIVWQDMVNNSRYSFFKDTLLPFIGHKDTNDEKKKESKEEKTIFINSMKDTISLLYNNPSIGLWTIFNEGWGQFDSNRLYKLVKEIDSTRIIDSTSGWFAQGQSDVNSLHIYFRPIEFPVDGKPIILSEFGGYAYKVQDHVFNLDKTYGYRYYQTFDDFNNALIKLYEEQIIPNIAKGLCAAIYTQVSDVEDEINGILTYDRKVCKVDINRLKEINQKVKL